MTLQSSCVILQASRQPAELRPLYDCCSAVIAPTRVLLDSNLSCDRLLLGISYGEQLGQNQTRQSANCGNTCDCCCLAVIRAANRFTLVL